MRVLIASPDRSLLRRLSWLLSSFGYDVLAVADGPITKTRLELLRPNVLMLDHVLVDGEIDATIRPDAPSGLPYCHNMLLYREGVGIDIADFVEMGFDDFLRLPISHVEVLSRLRVAARCVEYERRLETVRRHDAPSGFVTRRVLVDVLGELANRPPSADGRGSLVAIECDCIEPLEAALGSGAAHRMTNVLADAIREHCGADHTPARLDDRRFAVVLPDAAVDAAREWTERLRERFRTHCQDSAAADCEFSISCGIADLSASSSPEKSIAYVLESLQFARDNGGGVSVVRGEFSGERNEWLQSFSQGNPFAGSVAGDLVTPFTLCLSATDTLAQAAARFRRTRLEILPVYDADGRFLGIVREEDCEDVGQRDATTTIESLVRKDVPTVEADADITKVMEHFFGLNEDPLIVEYSGEPRGTIGHRSFAALVRPIMPGAFSLRDDDGSSPLTRLTVPDTLEGDDMPMEAADDSAVSRFSQRFQTIGIAGAVESRM